MKMTRWGVVLGALGLVFPVLIAAQDASGQKPPSVTPSRTCAADHVFCYSRGGIAPVDTRIPLDGAAGCVARNDPDFGCGSCRITPPWPNVATRVCNGPVLAIQTCARGFGDADFVAQNGCEKALAPCGPPTTPGGPQRICPPGIACVDGFCGGHGSCKVDSDCSDGVFCNGQELCRPGDPRATSAGCVSGTPVQCASGMACIESRLRCEPKCIDKDGDGHAAIGSCPFGDDCDDNDRNRYPGNAEVCDANNHDEDCDPNTFGFRDADGDGEADAQCCNREANGTPHCGTDCDDHNPAIKRGAQVCTPDGNVRICGGSGPVACPEKGRCAPQANGTGVCIPPR